jgi:LPS sulfotransferase NodH
MGKTDVNMPEYLRFVASKTAKDTGVFAVHAHVNQLMLIDEVFGVKLSDMTFTHVCYVYRRHLLAQAVSLALSQVTGKWRHDELPTSDAIPSMRDCEAARRDLLTCFQAYRDVYKHQVHAEYSYEEFTLPGHVWSFNAVLAALGKEPQQEFVTTIKRNQPNPLLDEYIQYRTN